MRAPLAVAYVSVRPPGLDSMESKADVRRLRRVAGPANPARYGLFRSREVYYEVFFADGSARELTGREVHRLLEGTRYPADMYAVLGAADAAFAAGDLDVVVDWPYGQRFPAPTADRVAPWGTPATAAGDVAGRAGPHGPAAGHFCCVVRVWVT